MNSVGQSTFPGLAAPIQRISLARIARERLDIALTLAAAFAGQFFLIISGIAAARTLGPESRGHLQILVLVPILAASIGGIGLPSALTYYIARAPASARAVWDMIAKLVIGLALAITVILAAVIPIVLSGSPSSLRTAASIVVLAIPGIVCQQLGQAMLQGQQRFYSFNVVRNLQVATYASSLGVLMLTGTGDLVLVAAIWSAATLGSGIFTLLLAVLTSRSRDVAQTNVRQMVRFGGKSLVGTLDPIDTIRLDQISLLIIAGPAALGVYVVGLAFSNLPRFIARSIGMVAYPRISGAPDPGYRRTARFVGGVALVCGAVVVVLELVVPRLVPLLFGNAYLESVTVTRIALVAAFLMSVRRILSDCARGLGWPEIGSIAEVAGTVTTVALTLLLGARWGAVGASVGLALGAATGLALLSALFAYSTRHRQSHLLRPGIGDSPIRSAA